jgi:hypothetical protein
LAGLDDSAQIAISTKSQEQIVPILGDDSTVAALLGQTPRLRDPECEATVNDPADGSPLPSAKEGFGDGISLVASSEDYAVPLESTHRDGPEEASESPEDDDDLREYPPEFLIDEPPGAPDTGSAFACPADRGSLETGDAALDPLDTEISESDHLERFVSRPENSGQQETELLTESPETALEEDVDAIAVAGIDIDDDILPHGHDTPSIFLGSRGVIGSPPVPPFRNDMRVPANDLNPDDVILNGDVECLLL